MNIGFYLLLKAKKMSVRDHPVMERLVQYQKVSQKRMLLHFYAVHFHLMMKFEVKVLDWTCALMFGFAGTVNCYISVVRFFAVFRCT